MDYFINLIKGEWVRETKLIELKIINLTTYLYSKLVAVIIKRLHGKQQKSLKTYNDSIEKGHRLIELAARIEEQAEETQANAAKKYSNDGLVLNAAINVVYNLQDDLDRSKRA